MGTTRGYVFVWREQGFQPKEIEAALRKVLWDVEHGRQQEYAARKALMRELVQSAGLPGEMLWQPFLRTSEPEAWACLQRGSRHGTDTKREAHGHTRKIGICGVEAPQTAF